MDAPNKRLRVAHIITQLELGGAQQNTLYTVSHLDPERYEPVLLCGCGGILDHEAKRGSWMTYFVRTLVRPVRPWKDVAAFASLYQLLRQTKPHIVHTHSSKAGILGRIAAYLAGVPVIIHTFHGFGFTPLQSKGVYGLFVWLEKACARLSTHLIFVSEDNRSEAARLGIGKHIPHSLIRSGIQLKATPEEEDRRNRTRPGPDRRREFEGARERFRIPAEAWVVTSIGNFKPQKNPMDLARTAEIVLRQAPDAHFLLVGDGELRPAAEAWTKEHGLEKQVHFLRWIRRRGDVAKVLAESNCFLLTSLFEGLPRALVEAAAAGKPAVAYDVNGVREILKDGVNGFLIAPGNVEAAAEKILWLSEHRGEARHMGSKGREMASREFDIDYMVRQQEDLYRDLYEKVPLKEYYEPLWAK